ncbi:olfactory receptor 2AK2-like [Elephas maximus indicus]|uniref:olfactory receptor 2AK2-like n=1 Tax=Elephas maximus indicus TaxID=99487 RepID=UPI0021160F22|nr:olfactory receptor 2AK2-like [Elephas maximus indicus]
MNTVLFLTIAGLFSVTLMGNIIRIHLIRLDTPLHSPVYFLLSQLSFIDMMYISTTVPKMAANFLSRIVNHFFCEVPSLLPLVCQDTSQYEYTVLFSGLIILLLPFIAILASYARVLIAVYQMSSGKGQTKAISMCSSHLIVASVFYGTPLSTYTGPHTLHYSEEDKVVVVFYSIITPLLNPFIYSLRNKEVMGAMRRVLGKWIFVQKI